MSQVQILLISWFCLTIFIFVIIAYIFYFKDNSWQKSLKRFRYLDLSSFINFCLATAAIVSSITLIYRGITVKELEDILGFDLVTLYLGGIAVIWLSIQQIWQIFKPIYDRP